MRFQKLELPYDCYMCLAQVFKDTDKYYKIMKKEVRKKDGC